MLRRAMAAALIGTGAYAGEPAKVVVYATEAGVEDAAFAVESAITDRGLVIDFVSHVGEMLERTRADVGSEVRLFETADIYLFCSAVVSRKVMEADPDNIANCPYGIFLRQAAGGGPVEIGYRRMADPTMAPVAALLDEIAREAAEVD